MRFKLGMFIALISLAASGFLSATILPGSSEAAFIAFLLYYPESWLAALISVTLANTAGSMSSYLIARAIPHKEPSSKALSLVGRYGSPLLFFSFLPVVGDLLPLAAGWLKLPVFRCLLFIGLGKLARYCVLLVGAMQFQ